MKHLLTIAFLLLCLRVMAQEIKGTVTDATTGKPIPNASIYLNGSSKGTVSDINGKFSLNSSEANIPLVISCVGYISQSLNNYAGKNLNVALQLKSTVLNEVVIRYDAMSNKEKARIFLTEFIGSTGKDCIISNPDDISFKYEKKTNTLIATGDKPLIILNKKLGYKITYFLDEFVHEPNHTTYNGNYFFAEDTAGLSAREIKSILKARDDAYFGSRMHFIRALWADNLNANNFDLFNQDNLRIKNSIITIINKKRFIQYNGIIKIVYTKGLVESISYIKLQDGARAAFIDSTGFYDQLIYWSGEMAGQRVNQLLPSEFKPLKPQVPMAAVKNTESFITNAQPDQEPPYLSNYKKSMPAADYEKVHLHLDKTWYSAGDTVWFKGYVVTGASNLPTNISGVLHVELSDSVNHIIKSIKLPVSDGLAYGDLALANNLHEGTYHIRAYTNWMRNAGAEYFFDEQIHVIGIPNNTSVKGAAKSRVTTGTANILVPATAPAIDVQFFPEGGYLLNGVASKVAFKAIGMDGLGKTIKGIITDNEGNEVAPVNSNQLGMGYFMLAPMAGKSYTAKISYGNNNTINLPLPPAKSEGYVLTADNSDSVNVQVKIIAVNKTGGVGLIVESGGEIAYSGNSNMDKPMLLTSIPKKNLLPGIARIILVSATGEPLNERLVFIDHAANGQLKLRLDIPKQTYAPREKVAITLQANTLNNSENNPITGNFSVAVINESEVPVDENTESTIYTSLLLKGELKGNIEQPNYYFSNSPQAKADLDMLLLTQGYGRYEQKAAPNNNTYQPEKGLSIAGRVMTLWNKPMASDKIFLINKTTGGMIDTLTDKDGYFTFSNLAYKDSTGFMLRTATKNNKDNVTIAVNEELPAPFVQKPASIAINESLDTLVNSSASITTTKREALTRRAKYEQGQHGIMLKEVNINRQRVKSPKQLAIEKYTKYSQNLAGEADQVFTAEDLYDNYATSLTSFLNGRITGVEFKQKMIDGKYVCEPFLIRANAQSFGPPTPMQVVLDGVMVGYVTLEEVAIERIASIEVLRNMNHLTAYGSRGGAGVLVVTTLRGDQQDTRRDKPPGLLNFMPKGYYGVHEFYSPKYTVTANNLLPDPRTTIYWQPVLQPGKDGKASFEYFNADSKGSYRIVVEGMDNNGNLARQVYRYKVE